MSIWISDCKLGIKLLDSWVTERLSVKAAQWSSMTERVRRFVTHVQMKLTVLYRRSRRSRKRMEDTRRRSSEVLQWGNGFFCKLNQQVHWWSEEIKSIHLFVSQSNKLSSKKFGFLTRHYADSKACNFHRCRVSSLYCYSSDHKDEQLRIERISRFEFSNLSSHLKQLRLPNHRRLSLALELRKNF